MTNALALFLNKDITVKTRIKRLIAAAAVQAAALTLPSAALAGTPIGPSTLTPINNIVGVIRGGIQFILVVAFVLAFVFLIIGGVRWIVSGGDEKAVAGARGMITASLIGLVIVLVAFAIIRLVEIFFNVDIISGTGVTIPTVNSL